MRIEAFYQDHGAFWDSNYHRNGILLRVNSLVLICSSVLLCIFFFDEVTHGHPGRPKGLACSKSKITSDHSDDDLFNCLALRLIDRHCKRESYRELSSEDSMAGTPILRYS